jgi:hypothetical protein
MSEIHSFDVASLAEVLDTIIAANWHLEEAATMRINKLPASRGARTRIRAILKAARDDGMIVQVDEEDAGFRKAEFAVLLYGSGQQMIDTLRALIEAEGSR